MLNELCWEPLASRRRAARLVMFYKIHHKLVEVNMPFNWKLNVQLTRTENSLAYHIPTTSTDSMIKGRSHHLHTSRHCFDYDGAEKLYTVYRLSHAVVTHISITRV